MESGAVECKSLECEVWSWSVELCSVEVWNVEQRIIKCGASDGEFSIGRVEFRVSSEKS